MRLPIAEHVAARKHRHEQDPTERACAIRDEVVALTRQGRAQVAVMAEQLEDEALEEREGA